MPIEITRHSPSSLNLFCASPAMWVLERVLGKRQPVGAPAFRGTAVEAGVAAGLVDHRVLPDDCVEIARQSYRKLTALSGDTRCEKYALDIERMVLRGLAELRPYGKPSSMQGYVEWKPEGLRYPIIGYYDFEWADHGIIADLKTTSTLPSIIKPGHARQVALYTGGNVEGRLAYITPNKSAVYRLENPIEHRNALHRIALAAERFLALSDDPQELVALTVPDLDSFYWAPSEARQMAYEVWKI